MLIELQNHVLEVMATGGSLAEAADALCRQVERLAPDALCSVLSVDPGGRLRPIAAPSLPPDFSAALEGLPIGPNVGSCGTAAFLRTQVIVTEIATDPLWRDYRDLALPLGLCACWSSPILDHDEQVIGTFAFYYRENRGPSGFEQDIVATCVHLCALAIERDARLAASQRLTYTDALTGLGNRARFNDVAARYDRSDLDRWALLLIDVDDLKVINDTFGHRAGDRLICVVAARVAAIAGPGCAFRLGGDEIAVVIEGGDRTSAEAAAVAILAALGAPAECDGHMLVPTATIGIAVRGSPEENSESVRQNADLALYHAKETARGGFVHHVDGLRTSITRRLNAILSLRAALDQDRIEPFYQPAIDLVSGRPIGLEALCRIRRDDGTHIAAAEFIEATSDAHLAKALTERMLDRIAADMRAWIDIGADFQFVAINLSSADFHGVSIAGRIAGIFDARDVPLSSVVIEVTESVYLGRRDDSATREIASLRTQGIRIALDDFGTGYASLTHLLTIPIDIIKIDRTFVEYLEEDRGGAAIINGIARIAEKLGLNVIAEGIETEAQAALLRTLGCQIGQGFHLAPPMDRDAISAFLRQRPSATMPVVSRMLAPHGAKTIRIGKRSAAR